MHPRSTGVRQIQRRNERGGTLVEQALVLAALLMVLFGIIDFGRALYTYTFVSNAAREATRWASVRSASTPLPGGAATNTNITQQFFTNIAGMALDPNKVTVNTNWIPGPDNRPVCSPAPKNNAGCVVKVQVKYDYKFMFPFLPTPTTTMTSTSEMVITQ